ncbi:MAG: hypothetical protein GY781_10405 [Gammaproteobacteria bacterium]|nr:hypothetical protein [Gammaproteobacteria bacterium]
MPEPKLVISCGDCAIDGGIYIREAMRQRMASAM